MIEGEKSGKPVGSLVVWDRDLVDLVVALNYRFAISLLVQKHNILRLDTDLCHKETTWWRVGSKYSLPNASVELYWVIRKNN